MNSGRCAKISDELRGNVNTCRSVLNQYRMEEPQLDGDYLQENLNVQSDIEELITGLEKSIAYFDSL